MAEGDLERYHDGMSKPWKTKRMKELFIVIPKLETERDTAIFFRDLCTIDELEKMAER